MCDEQEVTTATSLFVQLENGSVRKAPCSASPRLRVCTVLQQRVLEGGGDGIDCLDSCLRSHVVLRHQGDALPFPDRKWLAARLNSSLWGGCRFAVAAFSSRSTPLVTRSTTSFPPTYSNSIFCLLSSSKTNQQHYRCY